MTNKTVKLTYPLCHSTRAPLLAGYIHWQSATELTNYRSSQLAYHPLSDESPCWRPRQRDTLLVSPTTKALIAVPTNESPCWRPRQREPLLMSPTTKALAGIPANESRCWRPR